MEMKEIEFNLNGKTDPEDIASAKLSYIANRAANFNREKYDTILIPYLAEDARHFMLYKIVTMIAMARGVKVLINKKYRDFSYTQENNPYVEYIGGFLISLNKRKKNVLIFDTIGLDERKDISKIKYPEIFLGFYGSTITEIAKTLYDYVEMEGK